jgi:hypothetical protein
MKRISVDNLITTLETLRDEFLRDSTSARMLCDTLERELKWRVSQGTLDANDTIVEFH